MNLKRLAQHLKNPKNTARKLGELAQSAKDIRGLKHRADLAEKEVDRWRAFAEEHKQTIAEAVGPTMLPGKSFIFERPGSNADKIAARFENLGLTVREFPVDSKAYDDYLAAASYPKYPAYVAEFGEPPNEKTIQHYLSVELLDMNSEDILMDVASSNSVFTDILKHRYQGLICYEQDLSYTPGRHGNRIGSDARDIPMPDESITKMSLHCSFEHFEDDADTGFINESFRLLKSGGKVCVIPLYVTEQYHILTNFLMWFSHWLPTFEEGAPLYVAPEKVNVHGRFYDPEAFYKRLVEAGPAYDIEIVRFTNKDAIPGCPSFAAVFTKP